MCMKERLVVNTTQDIRTSKNPCYVKLIFTELFSLESK